MHRVFFRFYAELNDLLPAERRQVFFPQPFNDRVTVKHLIESLGVPHSEVDLILVDGRSVDFTYIVADGDQISVYPVFESLDIGHVTRLRPEPLRETRFVLDGHLGQLATYLRLLGFDSLYRNDYDDRELAMISSSERRILLTKDRGLLKRKMVSHGYLVRETDPELQMLEVVGRFDLRDRVQPFRRCLRCNGLTDEVPKSAVIDRLPANTRRYYDEFRLCRDCQQIYWKGSHYKRMQAFLKRTLGLETE
ncbi:MAG TPA: Mut7-C RNAse domain-containing protein [Anaerolineae bacterium]|nr:Mut7-C RNAse domain-containing protein [Anaerolineae bacterium]